jgi:hypothetical protein
VRRALALGGLLALVACGGGTGSGVITARAVVGIDSPVPTPATPTTEAGAEAEELPVPSAPVEEVVEDEAALRANVPFIYSVTRQGEAQGAGFRARYEGRFLGAPRTVTVVLSGERFRIEFEDEVWVYDGGVAAPGALRCAGGVCSNAQADPDDPPAAAVHEALQPLVSPSLMPNAVLQAVQDGAAATISFRTDGPEPASCASVEESADYPRFSYCVNPEGVVTAFEQGDDYEVRLVEWSSGAEDADFAPPFPVR